MKRTIIAILLAILLMCSLSLATVTVTTVKTGELDCDGATVAFSFSFPYAATSEVKVDVWTDSGDVASRQVETTDFSVSPSSSTSGGTVTFVTAPEDGNYLVISRTTSVTQDADIDAGAYTSRTAIEDALDEIYRILNEHDDAITRSMRAPQGEVGSDWVFGGALARASSYPYFGADGTPTTTDSVTSDNTVVSTFMETVVDDASAVAAIATLQGVSVINVMNTIYGAVGDDVVDDRDAINTAAIAAADGVLYFPPGTYKLSSDLTIGNTVHLVVANGAMFSIDNTFTLTLNCSLDAGLYQIFTGDGTVALGSNRNAKITEAFPEWWGAKNDGFTGNDQTDSSAAITAAIAATTGGRVKLKFSGGQYRIVDTALNMAAYDYWEGSGKRKTVLLFEGDTSRININDNITLIDMTLRGDATVSDGMIGIDCTNDGSFSITRVRVDAFDIGINLNVTFTASFTDCELKDNLTAGVGTSGGTLNGIHFTNCHFQGNAIGALFSNAVNKGSFTGGTIEGSTGGGIKATAALGNFLVLNVHLESNGGNGEVSLEAGGSGLTIMNCTIALGDNGVGINLDGTCKGVVIQGNRYTGGDDDDVAVVLGANVSSPILMKNIYDHDNVSGINVTDNTNSGYVSFLDDNRSVVIPHRQYSGRFMTFASGDTTPNVGDGQGNTFLSNATGVTITRFDDGDIGQLIYIISKGVTVYDTSTATRLIGSSVDITTADGDTSMWICEVAGTTSSVWRLLSWIDVSIDNS